MTEEETKLDQSYVEQQTSVSFILDELSGEFAIVVTGCVNETDASQYLTRVISFCKTMRDSQKHNTLKSIWPAYEIVPKMKK